MRNGILVLDPDRSVRQLLSALLRRQGYDVWTAATLRDGLRLIDSAALAAVLLELDLPDGDGLDLIEQVRGRPELRVLVVSGRGVERDLVGALDRGANDYVAKPFRHGELLARLRVALRGKHLVAAANDGLEIGRLKLHLVERRVYLYDKEVPLTPTEFDLLHVMARQAGRVVTHRQLLRDVWGASKLGDANYLRVFMYQLRQKLERNPDVPELLLTTPRVGYRLKIPA
jgi:two-component system KDP operon response regulator KdpE